VSNKRGFTQLPHGFYKRLWELKGVRLAVWLAHRCMENKEGTSWPSLETLMRCTGYDRHAIQRARSWLRTNGWLIKGGESRTGKGKFSVPVEHTVIPQAQETAGTKDAHGLEQKTPTVQAQNTAAVKFGKEVIPSDDTSQVIPLQSGRVEVDLSDLSDEHRETSQTTTQRTERIDGCSEVEAVRGFISGRFDYEPVDPVILERFFNAQDFDWDYDSLRILGKVLDRKDWNAAIQTQDDLAWRMESKKEGGLFAQFQRGWQGHLRAKAAHQSRLNAQSRGSEVSVPETVGSANLFDMETEEV
jgi:hypothetical protein